LLLVTGVVAAATAVGACGSSSISGGGGTPTIAQITAIYDALADSLLGDTGKTAITRGNVVTVFNGVIADSVFPVVTGVTTGNLQRGWFGNFANFVDSAGTDSVQVVTFWFGTQVQAYALYLYHNAVFVDSSGVAALAGDTAVTDSAHSIQTTLFSTRSGTCQFTAISPVSTEFPTYDPENTTCTPASALLNGFIYFFASDTLNPTSFKPVTLPAAPISGVRLQFTTGAGYPFSGPLGSIRARAAAIAARGLRRP